MSTSPYWRPVIPTNGHELPRGVKYALSPKYFDHDGSLGGSVILTQDDQPFLEGVKAGSNNPEVQKGISDLIEAIQKHDAVEFFLIG